MKKLIYLFVTLSSVLSYAQSDADLLAKDRKMSYGRIEQRLRLTDEALNVAQPYLDRKGVRYNSINQKSSRNESYTALKIETFGDSQQNREARRVSDLMGGMPLVFSPFDLSFGTNGYVLPDGSQLGVSYKFLIEGTSDSTYQHELLHATHLNDVVNGKTPLWAGQMQAHDHSAYVSNVNMEGYSGFAALDEMLTSALSVKIDTENLVKLKARVSEREFNDRWGEGHALISDIRFTLKNGENLAKQIAHLTERALANLDSVKIETATMKIGIKSRSRFHAVFSLDAYKGSGRNAVVIPHGTKFSLFYGTQPTKAQLKARLERILNLSRAAEPKFAAARKAIHMGLELPDVAKSDIAALAKLAPAAYETLK